MKYIIAYDISKSKYRKELSDYLLSERFIRIQKSVFLGNISSNEVDRIMKNCNEFVEDKKDSIFICPICIEDLEKSFFIGITFDMEDLDKFKNFIFYWGGLWKYW